MARESNGAVVVITGASSGIGRATALALARQGAQLVLAARGEEPLHELQRECEQLGAQALAVPTDVTDEQAVEALARRAVQHFGRIDVWINNAAVTLFARFEDAPMQDYRRVIETNVFGYIYGARAALRRFREQGSGVLIINASVVATLAQPYTSAYSLSKHAVRALAVSLRQELLLDRASNIHVCTVLPATIDTPIFQHAANYTGRAARAMPPVYPVEQVAETMVSLIRRPQREVYVGGAGRMLGLLRRLAPGRAERMMAWQVETTHLAPDTPAEPTPGNLFQPMTRLAQLRGGWLSPGKTLLRRMAPLGLAALGLGLLARSRAGLGMRRSWRRRPGGLLRVGQPIERALGRSRP